MNAPDSGSGWQRRVPGTRFWLLLLVVAALLLAARVVGSPDQPGPRLPTSFLQR